MMGIQHSFIDRLRLKLAWVLIPGLDKDEAKHRLRLVEAGQNSVMLRHKGFEQLKYLETRLGINHWEKPEPYNVDPEEYPTREYSGYIQEEEENRARSDSR